ncbi:MAG: neutral/alkaline non-lysosomal ceramidase N-terminal domain-containing protein [Kiritimatiellaeota bacterium]|nr:neutral/alkaline non-lysosomal ceramidase N-terminal domain-containing protein [Kiritimatiellota bacterium]
MNAGAARIDITPDHDVWMDGMIRAHRSTGVHDPLFAKALVLCETNPHRDGVALVSVDVCVIGTADNLAMRRRITKKTGIPTDRIILAATHSHSGPATVGYFNPKEDDYVKALSDKIAEVVASAVTSLAPAAIGCASGREDTISHYRRLLADDGHVVMNWEPWPAERIVRVLGVIDPEVGVLKIVPANDTAKTIALLFNHAGHPNVLSGDNYLLTPDYPGLAEKLLEKKFGGTALFFNGAQGSMDIDGLKDRDWEGRDRVGQALADAVAQTAQSIKPSSHTKLRIASTRYTVPARKISAKELDWADRILEQTGGAIKTVADGVGDDYKATLYRKLRACEHQPINLEQIGVAIGDSALISFPGELFTEVGQQIKAQSPLKHTWCLGLANGQIGYVPTRTAISQGGYESDTREADDAAAEQIVAHSLELLRRLA